MNRIYNIRYCGFDDLDKSINATVIHVCRSGAWTPPWLDNKFIKFIDELGVPYVVANCPVRKWDTMNISFSDQINYMMA